MKKLFKNWKTTFFGLTSICSGIVLIMHGSLTEGLSAITLGLGLAAAKDHNTID